nr:MAG TPA: hypothetical protein [Caudoviricetes sp.]
MLVLWRFNHLWRLSPTFELTRLHKSLLLV